jgi:dTDP-4-amino-4,6-dideoxygalactose transaminase
MNPIQFVDLRKQYAPLKEEILSGIAAVFDSMHLFLGENVQTLEKDFAQFCGASYGTVSYTHLTLPTN